MSDITAADKLACVKRELAMRRNVYPKWVASKRMSQQKADREIEVMEAIAVEFERRPIPVISALDGNAVAAVRNAALEEAAQVGDKYAKTGYAALSTPSSIAAAIRAMKVNP